jgi:uncharacterized membrane protein
MKTVQRDAFYAQLIAAGLLAGLRSVSAPATVSTALERGNWPMNNDPLVALAAKAAPLLRLLALGELAADKIPGMPSRTAPPILLGRILLGAASGLLLARASGREQVPAALVAGLATTAASFLGLQLRLLLSKILPLPGMAALIEDAIVLSAARAFVEHSG